MDYYDSTPVWLKYGNLMQATQPTQLGQPSPTQAPAMQTMANKGLTKDQYDQLSQMAGNEGMTGTSDTLSQIGGMKSGGILGMLGSLFI